MGTAFSQLATALVLLLVTAAIIVAAVTIVVDIITVATAAAFVIDRRTLCQHFLHVVGNAAAAHRSAHGCHAGTSIFTSTIATATAATAATAATTCLSTAV